MRRLITMAVLVGCLVAVVTATAASSPTVTNGSASNVTQNSATVSGTVNPNGAATTYRFQYGTTTSYGQQTAPKTLPAGTTPQNVTDNLTGLTPGTTYHYRLVASNASGTTASTDATFTTSGTAPSSGTAPTVVTGGNSPDFHSSTVTGSVNPNGSSTSWYFQYGVQQSNGTSFFELQTTPATVTGTKAVAVSRTISGLEANTTYQYRLVATNSRGTTVGAARTFKTLATARKSTKVSLRVVPSRVAKLPATFTASGKIRRPAGVSRKHACAGRVLVTFRPDRRVKKVFAAKRVKLSRTCTFKWRTKVNYHLTGTNRLKVTARFLGNRYVKPNARTVKVRVG